MQGKKTCITRMLGNTCIVRMLGKTQRENTREFLDFPDSREGKFFKFDNVEEF